MRSVLVVAFATTTLLLGCNKDKAAEPPAGMPPAPANLPPAAPSAGGSPTTAAPVHPLAGSGTGAPMAATTVVAGKIAEKIDAPSYTYLRITASDGTGDVWVAVPTATVAVGELVRVAGQMTMENFDSKALNRRFDKLVFGTLDSVPAGSAAAVPPGANPHAGVPGAPAIGKPTSTVPADIGDLKVAKAEGGYTVAELYGKSAALKDKPVTVRGKVVKYTAGVMGKNWVHLRDATGSDAKADNDITAVTTDETAVGEVVLVKGALHLDKDFGAGYRYPVIIEDAKLAK